MIPLNEETSFVKEFCISVLHELLNNYLEYEISYLHLSKIAKALHVLDNYPKQSINGYITISASRRFENHNLIFADMTIASEYFELLTGGSVYSEKVGSDSYSKMVYNSESGADGLLNLDLVSWKECFDAHKYNIQIVDESELLKVVQ